jgi:hypothetical protein
VARASRYLVEVGSGDLVDVERIGSTTLDYDFFTHSLATVDPRRLFPGSTRWTSQGIPRRMPRRWKLRSDDMSTNVTL